jgi:hypothetical protein
MKNVLRAALASAALVVLYGCGSVAPTSAPPPALTPPPQTPPPPVSSISATLSVPLSELTRLINDKAPQRFADLQHQKLRCGIGDCTTTLSATRSGPITLSGRGGTLAVGVPFALSANIALPPPLAMVNAGVNAAGQLNASTALAVGPDWQIKPNTGGTVQFRNGHLRLGPLDTDFASIWNNNSELLSRPLYRMLDAQMAPALAEQKQVAKLWAGVFAPIKLNAKPGMWMLLQPERIRVSPPGVSNNALTVGLGVDVRARLVVSDDAPSLGPTPLPPPAPLVGPANRFVFTVPAVLPYGEAARLGLEALQKNPPRAGTHTINISKLEIIPSGQDVVIAASFCIAEKYDPSEALSGCGSGYLRGVPVYDAGDQSIRIANLHYDVLTQNWMLSAMRGLAGDDLGKDMEKALQFKLGGQIKQLQAQVSAALAKPQGGPVSVSGTVQDYGPVTLTWSKDGFIAAFSAAGSVHADVHM